MKKVLAALTVLAALSLALPADAFAQEEPGVVARITFWTVRDGMEDEFEEGLKKHNAFHASIDDDWAIHTWQIVSGKRTGQYVRASFGHHWADFDREEEIAEQDSADSAQTLDPYIASARTQFYRFLPDLSRPAEGGPSKLIRVVFFHLHQGSEPKFRGAIAKAHAAIQKTGWGSSYLWHELEDGGSHPTYALGLPRDSWAGFAPQDKNFVEMLTEAYGEEDAGKVLRAITESIDHQWSETSAYREELSYLPGGSE
jgi:hypothetical protein